MNVATPLPLLFQGTLQNLNGNAVPLAEIQLWQTDLNGNYLHSNPGAFDSSKVSPNYASIVSDFQYFGTDITDVNGGFQFVTYRPGIYDGRPYSHFHFKVWLPGNDNELDEGEETTSSKKEPVLVTQFYFRDENPPFAPDLQLDVIEVDDAMGGAYAYGSFVNGTIIIEDADTSFSGGSSNSGLLQTSPTQPEGPFYPEVDFFHFDNDLTYKHCDVPTKAPAEITSTFSTSPLANEITVKPTDEQAPTEKPSKIPMFTNLLADEITVKPTDEPVPTEKPSKISTLSPTFPDKKTSKSPIISPFPSVAAKDTLLLASTAPIALSVSQSPSSSPPSDNASSASIGNCHFSMIVVWFLVAYQVTFKNFIF